MPKETVLAVIQARAGSKGVPGKNIRPLLGKPLMAWMIAAALRARRIDRLILSTDSPEYARIGRSLGVEVPFLRPKEWATDSATDLQVMTHALQWLREEEGYEPDVAVRLQPTNPTFPTELIDRGIEMLLAESEADSLRPVTPAPKHPFKMWQWSEEECWITPFVPAEKTGFTEPYNMSRHLLPPVWVQVGALEAVRSPVIVRQRSMAGKKILGLRVENPLWTVNIDTEMDFLLAEQALKILHRPAGAALPVEVPRP